MPLMSFIVATILLLSTLPAPATQVASADRPLDPAVLAYNAFIKEIDLNIPIDRRLVAGLLDQLASALEGVAIGRGINDNEFYARIQKGRRQLRRFADMPIGTSGREALGHQLFGGVAQLFKDMEAKLGSNSTTKPAVEAVDRAARSLELEDPLRWQPNNIENFLVLGGEALKQISATAPSSRR